MCDLQGPKIRVGKFKEGSVILEKGGRFILDAGTEIGDGNRSGLDYKELPRDVEPGALLLLDDGKIVLEVTDVRGDEVHTMVRHGGVLTNNKGINRQGGGLTAPALTSKDMEDIKTATKIQADYLAVSFPKSGADMYMARELMRAAGGKAFLIAKIERRSEERRVGRDCDWSSDVCSSDLSPTTRASTARAAGSPRPRSPPRTWRTSRPRPKFRPTTSQSPSPRAAPTCTWRAS